MTCLFQFLGFELRIWMCLTRNEITLYESSQCPIDRREEGFGGPNMLWHSSAGVGDLALPRGRRYEDSFATGCWVETGAKT